MKNTLLLILFYSCISFCQNYRIERETKQIIKNRSFYLNGGLKSAFGGKSRTYLKIDLPKNTKQWYYSFSTQKGKDGSQNLNLALQLAGMITDPSGITSSTLSTIKVPDGVASVDVYLCDRENIDKFLAKKDFYSGGFKYNMEGSTENTKNAVVEIKNHKPQTAYLGLKNPSANHGVNLSIEVVAIIEKKMPFLKPEKQEKAELYGNLGWSQFEKGNYEKCIDYCNKSKNEFKLGWVLANKGLALSMIEKQDEAIESYIEAISLIKKHPKNQLIFKAMMNDIKKAKTIKLKKENLMEIETLIKPFIK